jgi:hypothetical protein
MNINRAGKQQKACWRSEARCEAHWSKEPTDYVTLQSMMRGHAAGWIAGVAWAKKNIKAKSPNEKS